MTAELGWGRVEMVPAPREHILEHHFSCTNYLKLSWPTMMRKTMFVWGTLLPSGVPTPPPPWGGIGRFPLVVCKRDRLKIEKVTSFERR